MSKLGVEVTALLALYCKVNTATVMSAFGPLTLEHL